MLLMAMLVLMGMALIVTLARRVGRGSDRSSAAKQSHGGEHANGQSKCCQGVALSIVRFDRAGARYFPGRWAARRGQRANERVFVKSSFPGFTCAGHCSS